MSKITESARHQSCIRCGKDGETIIMIDVGTKKFPGLFAAVDGDDYESVRSYKWLAVRRGGRFYAQARIKTACGSRLFYMHRFILNPPKNSQVDHVDGDGLNNTRRNIRPCSSGQNCANTKARAGTSKYKGVFWSSTAGRWCAQIRYLGEKITLGLFTDETEAARKYDAAAFFVHGRFARLNLPGEQPSPEEPLRKSRALPKGVTMRASGRYSATICCGKKKWHIGTYNTIEEASIAYQNAVQQKR